MTKSCVHAFMAHSFSEVLGRVTGAVIAGKELIVLLVCHFYVVFFVCLGFFLQR